MIASACSALQAGEPVSCSDPVDERVTHRYAETDGIDPDLQSLDVYASATAQDCPVLIWVHGGSWQAGGKRTAATRVKADHFVNNGFVFVSINYRLASAENDIRWPDFGNDVADAAAWVIDNADTIGGDSEQVSLIGHSSGAHLVSIVATNPDLLERSGHEPSDLACVVSLDSVTHDLTDEPPWETDIIQLAFPSQDQLIDGSPTLQALDRPQGPDGPNVLVVTRGRDERIESAENLVAAITAGNGRAEVADVSPYDHSEVSVQLGVPGEMMVTPVVDAHLDGCTTEPSEALGG